MLCDAQQRWAIPSRSIVLDSQVGHVHCRNVNVVPKVTIRSLPPHTRRVLTTYILFPTTLLTTTAIDSKSQQSLYIAQQNTFEESPTLIITMCNPSNSNGSWKWTTCAYPPGTLIYLYFANTMRLGGCTTPSNPCEKFFNGAKTCPRTSASVSAGLFPVSRPGMCPWHENIVALKANASPFGF
jgi:hypothetical protein